METNRLKIQFVKVATEIAELRHQRGQAQHRQTWGKGDEVQNEADHGHPGKWGWAVVISPGLVQTASDIGKLSNDIQEIMKSVDEESLTNINEFRKFRTEINQYLDKKENELLIEIDQMKRTSTTLLNELKAKCTNIKSSIEKLRTELQTQNDNSNQLLIVGKRAMKELAGFQAALEEVSRRSEVLRYKFHRDPATEQLIASENAIGRLEEVESTSALGQLQRQQQTEQEQRQQVTTQLHQKQIKAVPQKGQSTAAVGQQELQQQKEQQPRQRETMKQQQQHMQGVSPKGLCTTTYKFDIALCSTVRFQKPFDVAQANQSR
ncbi:hypothetical protein MAR_012793 [Mya arenaria]|uniref:Uncharacterized protein n=1 Tax=Mya arenaria TaxID=6604 RepID=A0ABY7G0S4_MYAAR|nr:hypothetical protein MAR_012793 [Mya arenaria]